MCYYTAVCLIICCRHIELKLEKINAIFCVEKRKEKIFEFNCQPLGVLQELLNG